MKINNNNDYIRKGVHIPLDYTRAYNSLSNYKLEPISFDDLGYSMDLIYIKYEGNAPRIVFHGYTLDYGTIVKVSRKYCEVFFKHERKLHRARLDSKTIYKVLCAIPQH